MSKIQKTGKNNIYAWLISPEQRERVKEKKVGAMNIGPTWKEALQAEFSKKYYIEVSNAFPRCTQWK